MITRKTLAAGALGLGFALSAVPAFAQTATTTPKTGFWQNLVSSFASHFNLNEADVKSFFQSQIAAHQADQEAKMEQNEATRLSNAVAAGKLTQAQADLITAKLTDVKTQLQALQGKTGTDYKSAVQSIQDALKTWATANNIPLEYLRPIAFGRGRGRGMMGLWHRS